ncbi:hypothetical protein BCV72DRAFT_193399, partial [Rhizopus microsporus var. microsporus]
EDIAHFLYDCSPKLLVWKELWSTLFSSQFFAPLLEKALFKLEFPGSSAENEIPPGIGIASTLLFLLFNSYFFL